jgi:glyceraldehyde 3-phosphate dehydrogenase
LNRPQDAPLEHTVDVASRSTTTDEVNEAFRQEAATARYDGILGVSEDPPVSAAIGGDPRAAIVDVDLTGSWTARWSRS